jgi:hypothetical protein
MARRWTNTGVNWLGLAVFALVPAAWEAAVRSGAISFEFFPAPSAILAGAIELVRDGILLHDLVHTLLSIAIGWTIAMLVGVCAGLLLGFSPLARKYLLASIEVLRPMPENERLAAELARAKTPTPLPNDQLSELLKLRDEVGRLRASPRTETDPLNTELKALLAKVTLLKELIEAHPEEQIPELQFLTPHDWLQLAFGLDLRPEVANLTGPQTRAFNQVRTTAKDQFATMMAKALRDNTQANGGLVPPDLTQLKAYFQPPVDDAVLARYQVLRSGKLSDIPGDDMLVGEKPTEGKMLDTIYSISVDRFKTTVVHQEIGGRGFRGGPVGTSTQFIIGVPYRPSAK